MKNENEDLNRMYSEKSTEIQDTIQTIQEKLVKHSQNINFGSLSDLTYILDKMKDVDLFLRFL